MNSTRLFISQAAVVFLLVIEAPWALAGCNPPFVDSGSGCALGPPAASSSFNCDAAEKEIYEGRKAIGAVCTGALTVSTDTTGPLTTEQKACLNTLYKCKQIGTSGGDDYESYCAEWNRNQCPEAMSTKTEATAEKKEYQKELKDLKRDRADAAKDQTEKQKNAMDQMNQADNNMAQEDKDYQQKRLDLTQKMTAELSKMDSDKAKAVVDAQKQYDQINVQYIKLRDEIRVADTNASNMDLGYTVRCRNAANQKAEAEEAKLDQRLAVEDGMIRNFQLSSASGKTRRALKMKRDKIILAFNQFLARCLSGDVDPGTQIKLELDNKRNELANKQKSAADQSQRLENLRGQINTNLSQLQQQVETQKAQFIAQTQQNISLLDTQHQTTMNRLQQQKAQNQMMAMQQNAAQQKSQQAIDEQITSMKENTLGSSGDAVCSSNMDATEKAEVRGSKKKAKEAIEGASALCTKMNACSNTSYKDFCDTTAKLQKGSQTKAAQ